MNNSQLCICVVHVDELTAMVAAFATTPGGGTVILGLDEGAGWARSHGRGGSTSP
jgi:hypothetical protein